MEKVMNITEKIDNFLNEGNDKKEGIRIQIKELEKDIATMKKSRKGDWKPYDDYLVKAKKEKIEQLKKRLEAKE
jgi:DNA integrity scanning protein DisA with diadenylate cyclase activity